MPDFELLWLQAVQHELATRGGDAERRGLIFIAHGWARRRPINGP